jgi:hypothetical protein
MTSANFAAAQQRVLERRRQRDAEAQTRLAQQRTAPPNLERLPYPLNRLSNSGAALWDTLRGREGTRPAFRVGQVDAELLDEELLSLFKGQVGDALKYFGVRKYSIYTRTLFLAWLMLLLSSRIYGTNGPMRSSSPYAQSFSNSPYGITTPLMERPCRVSNSPTAAAKAGSPLHQRKFKRSFTVPLPSEGDMHGINGKHGLLIRKEATTRYGPLIYGLVARNFCINFNSLRPTSAFFPG